MLIQKQYSRLIFTGDLDWAAIMFFFIIEETKETILDFLQGTVRVLYFILF